MFKKGDVVKTPQGEGTVSESNKFTVQVRVGEDFKYFRHDELELVRSWEDYKKESLEKGNSIKQFREDAERMKNKIIGSDPTKE